ncbi:LytR/AlgR family response regulator transcription factor [Paenibacillus alkalitolerans]|uniref:LytR/AlgR family response regulator transcription factor n=1 Tax=Paenibacillus alkalitolerans TaxID=2799335 RepID=UPI0018F48B0F|nr:LytTR family DNA-binding domain-containing protein [Paenibacillus alkalitolerans]
MKIKVIIAEDERFAREELIYLLSKERDIELLPSAGNGRELLESVMLHKPDAVFLDIQMPELDGMEAARRLSIQGNAPYIVFTTAHEEYAVEAFRIHAVDYLLKPYDSGRLSEALNRIRQAAARNTKAPRVNKLLIDDREKWVVIDPNQVIYAVKEEKNTIIHLAAGETRCSRLTLQELEYKLSAYPFFRSHRSYLVNLNYIDSIEPWFNGAYNIILKDGKKTTIPVSRISVKPLFKHLNAE